MSENARISVRVAELEKKEINRTAENNYQELELKMNYLEDRMKLYDEYINYVRTGKIPSTELLMPTKMENVKVNGKEIEVSGRLYSDELLKPYDQTIVLTREYMNREIVVFNTETWKVITSFHKNVI